MKLKICGVTRQEDLDVANSLGFDFCGFIFHAKSPRYIAPEASARLQSGKMRRIGVFVNQTASEILPIMQVARLDYVQLHGCQTPADCQKIGTERVIRVLWPQRYADAREMEKEAATYSCAFYLLDAGVEGGGSGQALDWRELAGLRLPAPWFLAGGLDPENIDSALAGCAPWGLDLNSGLEDSPGIKNHDKIRAAIAAVRKRGNL